MDAGVGALEVVVVEVVEQVALEGGDLGDQAPKRQPNSSIRPVSRKIRSSARLVTRSPIRSKF